MFNYNSESDESLENMKLDLIKAKYAHQKLQNSNLNLNNNAKTKPINDHQRNVYKNLNKIQKPTNNTNALKYSKSPIMSNRKIELIENHRKVESGLKNLDENRDEYIDVYDDDGGDDDDDEDDNDDADISKMNEYVDYLLNKKRVTTNEDSIIDFNPTPIEEFQENAPSTNGYQLIEAYQKMRDYNPINNQSGDILAQWRLRRKMNEAQSSVQTEHQRHDVYIHRLKSQSTNDSQSFPAFRNVSLQDNQNAAVCDKIDKPIEQAIDEQVPVRDVINNNHHSITAVANTTGIRQPPPTSSDVSCQCQLGKHETFHQTNSQKTHNWKSSRHLKNSKLASDQKDKSKLRNVATLTKEAGRTKRKLVDCCIQTENYHTNSYNDINKELTEWNDRSASVDYIDRAIEKTLQSQLFERNYSSAMSTVTSINESQHIHINVENNSPSICTEDDYKDVANLELPWNEHFHIDSDDEFQQDEVLIDLRRRRQVNLHKLRNLSKEIQNCKSTYLASIESC